MKRLLYALSLFVLSTTTVISAKESTSRPQKEKRIKLGQKKERPQKTNSSDEHSLPKGLNLPQGGYIPANSQMIAKNGPGFNYTYNQYNVTRSVRGVGARGTTLTMDDQTIWEIASSSASTAKKWGAGTTFTIYPNNWSISSWLSSYEYALYNEATGDWVESTLSEGPFVKYAVLISDIDYYQGYVRLSDGSMWKMGNSYFELQKLATWGTRQAVLVGKNTGWFTPSFILININQNEYIAADFQPSR